MSCPVTHWQILSRDPERTAVFYGELFGWRVQSDNALGYRSVDTGAGGMGGGIWPAPPEGHDLVQLFVQVEDVGAAAHKAQQLGARIVVPPQVLPGGDELAILVDPQGLPFGVTRSRGASPGA